MREYAALHQRRLCATIIPSPGQAYGWLSHFDVAAGDVDGDGYSDILAAATLYDHPEPSEGVVFAYRSPSHRVFVPLVMRNHDG